MKKKDFKVELIRIISCLAVISYHVRLLPFKADGSLSETAVFFECLCTICVMTFFLISGFFIYNKNGNIFFDWFSLIISFFKNIFPPFIIAIIVSVIFHDYFVSQRTIIECIKTINIYSIISSVFTSLKSYNIYNLPGTCGHLWYIYSYFTIIVFYPITRLILRKTPKICVYSIAILFFIMMVLTDYSNFNSNSFLNIHLSEHFKPIIYSAFGYILYNDFLKKRFSSFSFLTLIVSFSIYTVTFILLFITQKMYYLTTNSTYVYTSWISTFSLVMTSAFIVFIYNIIIDRFIPDKIKNIVFIFSNKTYQIYVIHYFLITKFLSNRFQNIFTDRLGHFFQHIIYHIFYSLFIFLLSYMFALLVENIYNFVYKLCGRDIWLKEKTI